MSIRIFALVLLASASAALAAPPKSPPPKTPPSEQPPDVLDVDAMARAKDGSGAQPADADAPVDAPVPAAAPEASPTEAPITEAPPAPPATPEPAAPVLAEPSPTPPIADAAPAQANAPVADAKANEAPPIEFSPADSVEKSIAAGCMARATSLLDDAAKADYGSATSDFDAKMRTDLPAPKFRQQWESLAQFGKLVARGQSHLSKGDGYTLVMIPLIFEKTNLVAQIACGSDGRIAGFHVTQAPKPQF
ncbi:MAG TPA: DUF3887 domain-containing protein [Rhodanobacteraceae bacterium]|nr:DUF3887 domain-containing protein [Rhodanobacteraceae bacterium]